MISVNVIEITKGGFAPYGKLVEMPKDAKKESPVVDFWPNLVEWEIDDGLLEVDFGVVKNRPLLVEELERHLTTPELLIPIKSDLIITVASEKDRDNQEAEPLAKNVKAFLVRVGQAVIFNRGIWHFAPHPLEEEGPFFVVFKRNTPSRDFILKKLDDKVALRYEGI